MCRKCGCERYIGPWWLRKTWSVVLLSRKSCLCGGRKDLNSLHRGESSTEEGRNCWCVPKYPELGTNWSYPVSSIEYLVSSIWYLQTLMPSIQYLASSIRYPVSAHWCRVSGIEYPVSSIDAEYPVSGIEYPVSGMHIDAEYPVSRYQVSAINWCRVSGIEYPVSGIYTTLMPSIRYLASSIRYLVSTRHWCRVSGIWHRVSSIWYLHDIDAEYPVSGTKWQR